MRLILVNYAKLSKNSPPPRMGLAMPYLVSYLRVNGISDTKVFDFISEDPEYTEEALLDACEKEPSYVGFSNIVGSDKDMIRLMKKIKASGSKILVGGHIATIFPDQLMKKFGFIDYCIIGEGEIPLLGLMKGNEMKDIDGLAYRTDGKINVNPIGQEVDLDEIPFPARDALNISSYLKPNYYLFGRRYLTLQASRGCPARCNFCIHPTLNFRYRERKAGSVAEELDHMNSSFGVNTFVFTDPVFNCSIGRMRKLCRLIMGKGYTWDIQTRADMINNPDALSLMKKAGCRKIAIGVESGSQRMLDMMNKGTTVEQNLASARLVKDAGINLELLIMYGYPGERKEDIEKTLAMIKKIGPDNIVLSRFIPIPGAKAAEGLLEKGRLSYPLVYENLTEMTDKVLESSIRQIEEYCAPIQFRFIFNNLGFADKIRFLSSRENISKAVQHLVSDPGYLLKILSR